MKTKHRIPVIATLVLFTTRLCAQVPSVTTLAATDLHADRATLNGQVQNQGVGQAKAWFEWGTNLSYGNYTATNAIYGGQVVPLSTGISNLSTNATYHYRLVASNKAGTGFGDVVTFSTQVIPLAFGGSNACATVSNGRLNLHLNGSPGASIIIEVSPNLTDWSPWQTNTLPEGGLDLAIPVGTNQRQFVRARIQ